MTCFNFKAKDRHKNNVKKTNYPGLSTINGVNYFSASHISLQGAEFPRVHHYNPKMSMFAFKICTLTYNKLDSEIVRRN